MTKLQEKKEDIKKIKVKGEVEEKIINRWSLFAIAVGCMTLLIVIAWKAL